jgi:hypothetical protein
MDPLLLLGDDYNVLGVIRRRTYHEICILPRLARLLLSLLKLCFLYLLGPSALKLLCRISIYRD